MKFNELYSEFENTLKQDIEKAKELFANGELDVLKYNKAILKSKTVFTVELSDANSAEEALESLNEFFNSHEVIEAKLKIGFSTDKYVGIDNYADGYLSSFEFEAKHYDIIEFGDIKEYEIKSKFKHYVKTKIRPVDISDYSFRTYELDCKVMALYKDGIITLDQVSKATFSDCEI